MPVFNSFRRGARDGLAGSCDPGSPAEEPPDNVPQRLSRATLPPAKHKGSNVSTTGISHFCVFVLLLKLQLYWFPRIAVTKYQ